MSDNIGKIEFGPLDPEAIRQKRRKAEPEIVTMMDLVQQKLGLESELFTARRTIAEQAEEIERLRKALIGLTPSCRSRGCWCPGHHDLHDAGHSKMCRDAQAAIGDRK